MPTNTGDGEASHSARGAEEHSPEFPVGAYVVDEHGDGRLWRVDRHVEPTDGDDGPDALEYVLESTDDARAEYHVRRYGGELRDPDPDARAIRLGGRVGPMGQHSTIRTVFDATHGEFSACPVCGTNRARTWSVSEAGVHGAYCGTCEFVYWEE